MKNTMKYKRYMGNVAFGAEDRIFHGRVLGVSSALIGFEGATVADLEKDFPNAVDDYLEMCAEQGERTGETVQGIIQYQALPGSPSKPRHECGESENDPQCLHQNGPRTGRNGRSMKRARQKLGPCFDSYFI